MVKFVASVLTRCQVTWLGPAVVHPFEVPGVRTWYARAEETRASKAKRDRMLEETG